MKPPKGGTPAKHKPAIINAKLPRASFCLLLRSRSRVLNPWLFIMPIAMNASAVVKPPIRKKYRLPATQRGYAGDGDEVVADVCYADVCDEAFNVVL